MPAMIHDVQQGSAEWFDIRKGLATASEFECLVKRGRDGKTPSATRGPTCSNSPRAADRRAPGRLLLDLHRARQALEPEARDLYAMLSDTEPQQVGFITNHGAGCSPDSLVGD
jgi:hypothetical protein